LITHNYPINHSPNISRKRRKGPKNWGSVTRLIISHIFNDTKFYKGKAGGLDLFVLHMLTSSWRLRRGCLGAISPSSLFSGTFNSKPQACRCLATIFLNSSFWSERYTRCLICKCSVSLLQFLPQT